MKEKKIIKGYKGYDKDLKCRDFQFEIGKEYEEAEAEICKKGFHFCENPLDIFKYYKPNGKTRFTEVEGSGIISNEKDKYCKRINYYGQDEYAIVGESEVIDIDCGLYVAKYTFNNSILTIF